MMKPINLEQWKPKAHPLKAEIKKHGVTISILQNYLGLKHYSYVANMLNGVHNLPEKHEKKIKALLYNLELQKQE